MKNKINYALRKGYDKESLKFENNLSLDYEKIEKSKTIYDIDLKNNIAVPKKLETIA